MPALFLIFLLVYGSSTFGFDLNVLDEKLHFVKVPDDCKGLVDNNVNFKSFYILDSEITQSLFVKVMSYNPSYDKRGGNYPVDSVSISDINEFTKRLYLITGKKFRLPTEKEWIIAASSLYNERYAGTNNHDFLHKYAVFNMEGSQPIKSKLPNKCGLYDMSGNVWELVLDGEDTNNNIIKGGGWNSNYHQLDVYYKTVSNSGDG